MSAAPRRPAPPGLSARLDGPLDMTQADFRPAPSRRRLLAAALAAPLLSAYAMPPSAAERALKKAAPQFLAMLKTAGFGDILAGRKAVTLFAPSDAAIAALPADFRKRLTDPVYRVWLQDTVARHIVAGDYDMKALTGGNGALLSAGGEKLHVAQTPMGVTIGGTVVGGDSMRFVKLRIYPLDAVLRRAD